MGGFPSLAFMDAEGEVLTSPRQRSVESFNATLDGVQNYLRLKEKAAGGDETVANALFLAELDVSTVSHPKVGFEEAVARFAELRGWTADEKKTIENELVSLEFVSIIIEGRQLGSGRAARKKAADMAKAGRIPSGRMATEFWRYNIQHAEAEGDWLLFTRAVLRWGWPVWSREFMRLNAVLVFAFLLLGAAIAVFAVWRFKNVPKGRWSSKVWTGIWGGIGVLGAGTSLAFCFNLSYRAAELSEGIVGLGIGIAVFSSLLFLVVRGMNAFRPALGGGVS